MIFRAGSFRLAAACLLAASSVGCLPKIGDKCTTSLDCSQTGQKICDNSQPAGYCTVFNCEPDNCPDGAACVAFNNNLDPACGNHDDGSWPRFERTFCVRPCGGDGDCRDGYECVSASERGGIAIDVKTVHDKICVPAVSVSTAVGNAPPKVCDPPDSTGTLPDPYTGGTAGAGGSTGGAGGSTGGAGGSTGGAGGSTGRAGGVGGMSGGTGGMSGGTGGV